MAVISLDFVSVFCCPSTSPASLIHALTVCTALLPLAVSKLRRLVFPSTAICLPPAFRRNESSSAQCRNTALKASGSSAAKTARYTSWVGGPWGMSSME